MEPEMLCRFPVKVDERELPRSWYWSSGNDEKLVVIYPTWDGRSLWLAWIVIDLNTISVKQQEILLESVLKIEALQLTYHEMTKTWLLVDLELGFGNPENQNTTPNDYLVVRAFHEDKDRQAVPSSHLLFADPANDMAVMGPLLSLKSSDTTSWVTYVKQEIDDVGAQVCQTQVAFASGQVNHSVVNSGRTALHCWGEQTWLLLSCGLRTSEFSGNQEQGTRRLPVRWCFSAMGGKNETSIPWRYHFEGGIAKATYNDLFRGPIVINAAAIEGPTRSDNGASTFVVGMTMMNTQDNPNEKYRITAKTHILEQVDRLLCIDSEGNLLQTFQGSVGLYMGLCRAGNRIVGVDLVGDQWRLWTWKPLEQSTFDQLVLLDHEVQRACVIAENEPGQDSTFWLIEEYRDQISISKRSAATLEQVGSGAVLSDVHLLLPQSGYGRLDWHTEVDALVDKGVMLLLAVDKDEQLVLYRMSEGK